MTEEHNDFKKKKLEKFLAFMDGETDDFDMWAQNPDDWKFLHDIFPNVTLTSAGGVVPFQAEGTIEGLAFYYRERHGIASLKLSYPDYKGKFNFNDYLYESSEEVDEFRSGPEWVKTFINLVGKLERAYFRYEFPSKEVELSVSIDVDSMVQTGKSAITYSWGASIEEAYERTKEISEFMLQGGWSEEAQRKLWSLKEISPSPSNSDDRVFPEPDWKNLKINS